MKIRKKLKQPETHQNERWMNEYGMVQNLDMSENGKNGHPKV